MRRNEGITTETDRGEGKGEPTDTYRNRSDAYERRESTIIVSDREKGKQNDRKRNRSDSYEKTRRDNDRTTTDTDRGEGMTPKEKIIRMLIKGQTYMNRREETATDNDRD